LLWKEVRAHTYGKPSKNTISFSGRFVQMLKVAAVFIPFLVAAYFYFFLRQAQPVPEEPVAEIVIKENPKGQKLQVTFPDGSKVRLNADSRLTFQKPFDDHQRVVTLQGEAFFEIAKDPQRPFIVQAGAIKTTVLGTSFNVRAYPEEDDIQVAVATGKVAVEKSHDTLGAATAANELVAAQMLTYHRASERTHLANVDVASISAWSNGVLMFHNASFGSIVKELERWYGVEFIITRSEPIKRGFSGSFENESLEQVLEGLAYASEFEYQLIGNKVLIR
jgi:ferric-dicitrate binding protein FerR (iron transport regulator)